MSGDERFKADIEREIREHGDVLPPWKKYPHIERYSIGWRMGYGEDYLGVWWAWTKPLDKTQLVGYFKRHAPIPREWLDWVAYELGIEENFGLGLAEEEEVAILSWLAEKGLDEIE